MQGDAVREDQHRLLPPLLPQTRETSAKVSGLRVRLFIATRSQKVYSCLQFPDSWLNRYKTFFHSHMQGSFCGHACAMHYLPVLLSNRFDISGYSSKSTTYPVFSYKKKDFGSRTDVFLSRRTTYPVFSYKNGIWDLEQMYFNHVGTQSLVTKMGFLISNRCIFKQGT